MSRATRRTRRKERSAPGMPDDGSFRSQMVNFLWGWLLVVVVLAAGAGLIKVLIWAWRG